MATWIAHMRIAEYFMNKYPELNNTKFLVGNIGPDCGVPNEDWSAFTPDKNVTHRMPDGENIDAESFKDAYLSGENPKPFYLGYYFHLLTDIQWKELYTRKKEEPVYYEGLAKDPGYIRAIKRDWYGQDHLFLQRNPDSVFFTVFAKIREFDNTYLDYFPENAFIRQINHITNFYLTATEDPDREFLFLSKEEMNSFVEETIKLLDEFIYTAG